MSELLRGRLVIVEDEAIVALDLERTLTALGFDVRGVAADSDEAEALVQREHPDLVLMDIRIQGTRDGVETAERLREQLGLPVVFLTAHGDTTTIERAHRARPLGYLLKPFKKPDLQNVISIALARNAVERDLRQREEMLHTTLECIDEAILSTDVEGRITYGNPAAATLLGRPVTSLHNKDLDDELPLRCASDSPLVQQVRDQRRLRLEGTLTADAKERRVVGTAAMVTDGPREFGVVVVLQDLTELFQARRQLEFAERLSALGTLAAGVAHELNNPLSVVLANVRYAMDDDVSLPAPVLQALQEAADAGDRMRRIVQELQTFSRPQQESLRPFEPLAALGAAVRMTRARWRRWTSLALELGPTPLVSGSPTKLTQVFVNLLINAVQAMEAQGGGHLTLRSRTNAAGEAELTVSDSGPGIPPALRERIFEPFFTTKEVGKGTGLGLAITRTIVENYRGVLEVGPGEDGIGTTFTVVLPPADAARPAMAVPLHVRAAAEPAPGCLRVEPNAEAIARAAATAPDSPLLLEVDEAEKRALREPLADLEARCLELGLAPQRGEVRLRPGFDAHAVSAFLQSDAK